MRSGYRVYLFHNCRHGNDKRCYLGHYRNGTMRLGRNARKSQETAQWLTTPPGEDLAEAEKRKDEIHKGVAWTPPPPPPPSPTPKPVDKREQKRKRVRRWCRNLTVILKHPEKFRNRCEYDCDILEKMIQRPERHMRRCLHRQIVRRKRKKARKLGETLDIKKVKAKARARVKILWPKRDEIFRRLRQLRRCNKRRKAKQRKASVC
nr:hypothetical protein BaRGS_019526 [Batillaria attramentaria]